MSWWHKAKIDSEPWHGWYVVCQRGGDLDYFGGKYYTKHQAQELADEWTARFNKYYWVESQDTYDQYLAKKKTEILEREVGIG